MKVATATAPFPLYRMTARLGSVEAFIAYSIRMVDGHRRLNWWVESRGGAIPKLSIVHRAMISALVLADAEA